MVKIFEAGAGDHSSVWSLLEPVIRAGETYALPRDMNREDALAYWMGSGKKTYLAELEGRIAGTYYLRANQMGGGSHVANCGYVTAAWAQGKGIATALCQHSIDEATRAGFRAMQFNLVVSTNAGAVKLWQKLGFDIVGTLPGAFSHPSLGDVEAYVMYRRLKPV